LTSGLTGGPFAVQVDLETRTPDPFPSSVKLAESNAKLRESHERAKVHETMMMEMAEKANLKQTEVHYLTESCQDLVEGIATKQREVEKLQQMVERGKASEAIIINGAWRGEEPEGTNGLPISAPLALSIHNTQATGSGSSRCCRGGGGGLSVFTARPRAAAHSRMPM
jgi:hypothetical protein